MGRAASRTAAAALPARRALAETPTPAGRFGRAFSDTGARALGGASTVSGGLGDARSGRARLAFTLPHRFRPRHSGRCVLARALALERHQPMADNRRLYECANR